MPSYIDQLYLFIDNHLENGDILTLRPIYENIF